MKHPQRIPRLEARTFAVALGLVLALPLGVWAQGPSASALGENGEILVLRSGPYGDLFGDQGGTNPATWVLALETQDVAGNPQRQLVPGTADGRLEAAPRLIPGAEGVGTLALWHSVRADGRFEIRFATRTGGDEGFELSPVAAVENANGPLAFATAPLIAVTRDAFGFDGDEGEGALEGRYTLVHLLWRTGGETPALRYTVLTFVDGLYIGWNQVFDLGGLLALPEGVEAGPALSALDGTLELAIGPDGRSLVVTAANAASGRLGSFQIDALPVVLTILGDQIRDEIYGSADLFDPEDLVAFIDKIKGGIIAIGHRAHVHPAMTEYLSDRVGGWLEETGADYGYEEFTTLGDDARDLAIDLSSSVAASVIEDPSLPGSTLVEINVGGVVGGDSNPAQLLDLRELTNLAAPELPQGAAASVVTSSDGERLAVLWPIEGGVTYVESQADGTWSAARRLPTETIDEAAALVMERLR